MSLTKKTLEHLNPACSLLPEGADTEAAEAARPTQAAEAAHMQAAGDAPSTEAVEAVQEAAAVAGAAEAAAAGAAAYGLDLCASAKPGARPNKEREHGVEDAAWFDLTGGSFLGSPVG